MRLLSAGWIALVSPQAGAQELLETDQGAQVGIEIPALAPARELSAEEAAALAAHAWREGCWALDEAPPAVRVLAKQAVVGSVATTYPVVQVLQPRAPSAIDARGQAVPDLPRKEARRLAAIRAHNTALADRLALGEQPVCPHVWWGRGAPPCPALKGGTLLAWLQDQEAQALPDATPFTLHRAPACKDEG